MLHISASGLTRQQVFYLARQRLNCAEQRSGGRALLMAFFLRLSVLALTLPGAQTAGLYRCDAAGSPGARSGLAYTRAAALASTSGST
jgi:hypothetical protein